MTTFPDYRHFEDETTNEPLVLPVHGVEYSFSASLDLGTALEFQVMRAEMQRYVEDRQQAEAEKRPYRFTPSQKLVDQLNGTDENELYMALIGDEMKQKLIDNKVSFPVMLHIGATLFAWHMNGSQVARHVWTRGKLEEGDVSPPAGSTGVSRPSKTSPRSSSPKKPRNSKAAAARSRGATTSNAGRSSKRTSSGSTTST
ncbi:hypothetical protein CFN78_06700 [Amycolatopsis antarctica]|uniref:DUF7426 domain-containing protein n=1 Tax=Amycolatopsis antarctica TaxID=1854586 RepID=A0A263D6H1_9PSEU|nr:hypothetical protein [Amycolatopsis antarctica]OZM73971.1 hypothetical protein CFN78_06700 [Amycolatopsis antarctica]